MMKKPEISSDGDVRADVIIVGSGAVGAMAANELLMQGYSVFMLEAGLRVPRSQILENWRNMPYLNRDHGDMDGPYPLSEYAAAPLYYPPNDYVGLSGPDGDAYAQMYLRTVGGTTWHWSASCWRHSATDMKMKTLYGVGRDWPFDYETFEPFYVRAEAAMGVAGPWEPELQSPRHTNDQYPMDMVPWAYGDRRFGEVVNPHGYQLVPIPQARSTHPWKGRPTCCGNNNCMPICPIGAMYNGIHTIEEAEARGLVVRPEAVVHRIDTDENNVITGLEWLDAAVRDCL